MPAAYPACQWCTPLASLPHTWAVHRICKHAVCEQCTPRMSASHMLAAHPMYEPAPHVSSVPHMRVCPICKPCRSCKYTSHASIFHGSAAHVQASLTFLQRTPYKSKAHTGAAHLYRTDSAPGHGRQYSPAHTELMRGSLLAPHVLGRDAGICQNIPSSPAVAEGLLLCLCRAPVVSPKVREGLNNKSLHRLLKICIVDGNYSCPCSPLCSCFWSPQWYFLCHAGLNGRALPRTAHPGALLCDHAVLLEDCIGPVSFQISVYSCTVTVMVVLGVRKQ